MQEIENQFAQLPRETQWQVIERLVDHLHRGEAPPPGATWETNLAAMAADPAVRCELEQIEQEFASAEADGLREF